MPERILALSQQVSELATKKVQEIQIITMSTKILSLNAAVEAARAGEAGRGFAVVAGEVNNISQTIQRVTEELQNSLSERVAKLNSLGRQMVANVRGRTAFRPGFEHDRYHRPQSLRAIVRRALVGHRRGVGGLRDQP